MNKQAFWEGWCEACLAQGVDSYALSKQAQQARSAVLVHGNPKYVEGPDKALADRYYQEIEDLLKAQGIEVSRDRGDPYTSPTPADIWLGHSRGVDRLRFAPEGTQTIPLGSDAEGAITHPADLEHMKRRGIKVPPVPEHYMLTPEMRQELLRRVQEGATKAATKKFLPPAHARSKQAQWYNPLEWLRASDRGTKAFTDWAGKKVVVPVANKVDFWFDSARQQMAAPLLKYLF